MTRREFLRETGRILLALLLFGGAAALIAGRRGNRVQNDVCSTNGVCRNCPRNTGCGHPTARSFRGEGRSLP